MKKVRKVYMQDGRREGDVKDGRRGKDGRTGRHHRIPTARDFDSHIEESI